MEQLQHAVDDMAEKLHRSVVIDDESIRLLVASRHFGDEDEVRVRGVLQREAGEQARRHVLKQGVTQWTTAGVIPPQPEIGMQARVCVPIRWQAELLGLLMVIDSDRTLTSAELAEITAAAADMAPHLKSMLQNDLTASEEALWDLVGPHASSRRQALSDLVERHDPARFSEVVALRLQVAVADGLVSYAAMTLTSALRVEAVRSDPAPFLHAVRDSSALVILGVRPGADRKHVAARATRIVTRISDLSANRFQLACGVGTVVDGLDKAVETYEQAELAAAASGTLLPGPVVFWEDMGALASLMRIPASGRAAHALPWELKRLLEIDTDGQLTATVRAYLDHGGSSPDAAQALHIHRTTLYYRLGRVQELAGLDLADGRTRLALHVGLELMSIAQALQGE